MPVPSLGFMMKRRCRSALCHPMETSSYLQICLAPAHGGSHVVSVKTPRYRSAFTLIELLVVIAIIGILASLALPAVNGALDSARRAQAKNDVVQIATAIVAYETEYGKFPGVTGSSDVTGSTVDGTLVKTLTGEATNDNPRKIVFLEVQEAKNKKSGTNGSGTFIDPWSNTYQVSIDGNYDNSISAKGQTLRKKVAVWNAPTESSNRRSVSSWE